MQRNDGRGGGGGPRQEPVVSDAIRNMRDILDPSKDPNGELLIKTAEAMGEHLSRNRMTTAQIRRLFGDVKRLNFDEKGPYRINVLRAHLAYAAGRHRQVEPLQQVLDASLREIGTSRVKFERFSDFFEAVVAYHRKFGGKE